MARWKKTFTTFNALPFVTNQRTRVKGDTIKVEVSLSEQIAGLNVLQGVIYGVANDDYMRAKYQHTPDTIYQVINDTGAL